MISHNSSDIYSENTLLLYTSYKTPNLHLQRLQRHHCHVNLWDKSVQHTMESKTNMPQKLQRYRTNKCYSAWVASNIFEMQCSRHLFNMAGIHGTDGTLKSSVGVSSPPSNNYHYRLRNLFMLVDDILWTRVGIAWQESSWCFIPKRGLAPLVPACFTA
jgi:hypothetical protein